MDEALFAESGHIGICIVPSYRHRGYGKRALRSLLLEVYKRYDVKDILLVCSYDNVQSYALCKKMGGVKKHEDSVVHYWFSEHVENAHDK